MKLILSILLLAISFTRLQAQRWTFSYFEESYVELTSHILINDGLPWGNEDIRIPIGFNW